MNSSWNFAMAAVLATASPLAQQDVMLPATEEAPRWKRRPIPAMPIPTNIFALDEARRSRS